MPLTAKSRQHLKTQAHKLKPVVLIGNQGLTLAVKKEIDRALNDHELIKVRIVTDDRELKKQMFAEICQSLGAELVQQVGKIGAIYRKNVT